MIPSCPRWGVFFKKLKRKLKSSVCNNDYKFTREVFAEMGNIDIEASIKLFKKNGGACDCEIIFNIDEGMDTDEAQEPKMVKTDYPRITIGMDNSTGERIYRVPVEVSLSPVLSGFFRDSIKWISAKEFGEANASMLLELFDISGVIHVMVGPHEIHVMKKSSSEWKDIEPQIIKALKKRFKD